MPLANLDAVSGRGCFSDRPLEGAVPFYGLDTVQERAIAAALARLSDREGLDLNGEIDWRLKQLNCYACHERDGIGGPETSREVYFGFADENAIALGRWGNLPPSLDHVGAKLTSDWLGRVLQGVNGGGSVMPYLASRMPVYRPEDTGPFLTLLPKSDEKGKGAAPGLGGLFKRGSPEEGKEFFGENGKKCVQCHDAGPIRSNGLPGIDLATSPIRLQRRYFDALLLDPQSLQPGTLMPDPFGPEDPRPAMDALWSWLKTLGD